MRIKLTQPHTDAGRDYPPGAELELRDDQAEWLIALKRAERVPTEPADTASAAPAKKPKE